MRKVLLTLVLLALAITASAEDFTVSSAEYIVVTGSTTDTVGRKPLIPDSIVIFIADSAQTTLHDASYTSAAAQASLDGNYITFSDQWNDINGAATIGIFHMTVTTWSDADNNVDVSSERHYTIRGVSDPLQPILDNIDAAVSGAVTLAAGQFTKIRDTSWEVSPRVLTAATNLTGMDVNVASVTAGAIESGDMAANSITSTTLATDAITAAQIAAGAITPSEAPYFLNFDTSKYRGAFGHGVWVDQGAGNTNTVVGVDGVENHPVSTFAAARTIADALGIKRYYINGRSQFTGANDLTVTHEEWEFFGIGHGVALELDVGGVDVDGSVFTNMMLFGTQGGTEDITVNDCEIGRFIDVDGHFNQCGLTDTVFIAATDDLFLDGCHSELAGSGAWPGVSFGAGNSNLSMRHYSGGIEVRKMNNNDNMSIEGMGQVVINNDCTAPTIAIRGFFTLDTNNVSAANITKDAVFSRQEALLWIYSNIDTAASIDTSDIGTWFSTGINASISAANISAIADSSAKQVWGQLADSAFAGGSMGDSAKGWGATAAGSLDSAFFSRIIGRKVWGIDAGAGDSNDSSVIADRKVGSIFSTVSIGATDMARIGDSVWEKAFNTAWTAGTMGDSLNNWTYTGSWGATRDALLKSFWVSNSAGDAVRYVSTGSGGVGHRITGEGGGAGAIYTGGTSANSSGVEFVGGPGGGAGMLVSAQTGNFNAIFLSASGSGVEITFDDLVDGVWDEILATHTDAGSVGDVFLDTLDALVSSAGGVASISDADMAAIADSVWQALLDEHDGTAGSFGDSAKSWKGIAGGGGTGSDTITIFAVDTSGTDEAVADVKITIQNAAESNVDVQFTNSSGSIVTKQDPATYQVLGRKTGFIWPTLSLVVSGNSIDTVFGYDIAVDVPGDADLAFVQGYIKNSSDIPVIGAFVRASRSMLATDTAGTSVIIPSFPVGAYSDTLGLFRLPLRRTGTYADTTKGFYDIKATFSGNVVFDLKKVWVPASGNLNLADSLLNRN